MAQRFWLSGRRPSQARVATHVIALQKSIEQTGAAQLLAVDNHMKAVAARLKVAPVVLKPTELELKASTIVPKQRPLVIANGYQGYRDAMPPAAELAKFRGLDTNELQRLVNGKQNLLDMKKMIEAQGPVKADLQLMIDYMNVLAKAGLVEIPAPPATKAPKK